ncbi:MAG: YihY/virulence factor BrkB family protein [Hungatella sp.]|nr:YihY/virulence factor BrkB family protein [Hungatella sp.]
MISLLIQGKRIFDKYKKDEVTVYAAQASFFIVISFFPFIMLLLTLIQFIPALNKSDVLELLVSIMPDMLDSLVIGIVDELYTKSPATVVSLSAIVAIWSASRGMLGIERGLNRVYESPQPRGYIVRRLICSGYTVLFVAACIASLLLLVLGGSIQRLIIRIFPVVSAFTRYVISFRSFLALAVLVIVFTGLYTLVPVRSHSMKSQLPGALFSTLGWIVFSGLFSIYFNNFSNYSYMYGSLTAVVVLMLWLYICICILLIGAELNYHLERFSGTAHP